MWFFLALTSALIYSFRRLSEKKLSQKINPFTLAFALQAFSLPGIALLLLFADIPNLSSLTVSFWFPLLIIWIILYPLQGYTYYKALKHGEISYILPLLSLIPIFNIAISWFLLGEIPSVLGFLGILAIVAGIYFLNMKSNTKFYSPLTHLFTDRPSLLMIINCLCLALGSTLDKIAVQASNPLFYAFVNTLGASVILLIFALYKNSDLYPEVKSSFKGLGYLGIFQSLAFTTYIIAVNTGIVSYVLAIKSSSAIIGSVWGFIFLKETFTRYKVLALVFITLGLGLIALA